MINLLPETVKQNMKFAKRNALVLRYIEILGGLAVAIALGFAATHIYLDSRVANTDKILAQRQTTINSYREIETRAKVINEKLAVIKTIQATQPKFSKLIQDLAAVMPPNTSIDTLALTGEPKTPVRLSASAGTYAAAVSLRDALVLSPRISGADLETVSGGVDGFKVSIVIGFKPDQAK